MTILNFNKVYDTVADNSKGAIYCYTIDRNGGKHTHRVLFSNNIAKTMSELSKKTQRKHRKVYENDSVIMEGQWNKQRFKTVYVEVFLMDNMPNPCTLLSRRIKKAIYTYQQSPIESYNMLAKKEGWGLLKAIDENNNEYVTTDSDTIVEEQPLRINIKPKFTIDDRIEKVREENKKIRIDLVLQKEENQRLREEQKKHASLIQQMFLLLSTWFAMLGGNPKRT